MNNSIFVIDSSDDEEPVTKVWLLLYNCLTKIFYNPSYYITESKN